MTQDTNYKPIPKFIYVRDAQGVPDGKKQLSSVSCSCGRRMILLRIEPVDCGFVRDYECPLGHTGYCEWDLIDNC